MKIKRLFKIVGFLAAIIPFDATACQQRTVTNETYLPTHTRTPKYLLAGELDIVDGDFIYYSINNGTEYAVALKESAKSSNAEITIESEYNNKPVTGIWRSGFYESKSTKINIPSSITVIDYEAFLGSRITSVSIPASVSQIGEGAFYSCKQLTKATIQNSSSTSASSACSCDENLTPPSGPQQIQHSTLKVIPSFCFFNCVSLRELVLPESIEEIEYEAFNGCLSLYSTLAFTSLKTIRSRAFQNCVSLRQIYISSDAFFDNNEQGQPAGIIEDKAFNNCNSSLQFHLSGDSDRISTWLELSRNLNHWNVIDELKNPESVSNQFSYEIETGGASYSNDWIYTTDVNNDVHITSYIGPTEIEGVPVKFLSMPNELPSGEGHYVRSFATDALVTVRANLERLYLPTTLRRIENSQFDVNYTNLAVIDDNTQCSADQTVVNGGQTVKPKIVLNRITDLEVIGTRAFLDMPKLNTITKLYLPYSLKAVGSRAFGSSESNYGEKHLRKVTDFKWEYNDTESALEVIGREAFYKLGMDDNSTSITKTIHFGRLKNDGTTKYDLTTLIIPRTFKHFGILGPDKTAFSLSEEDGNANTSAFAACPLLGKVVFKGSLKSVVQSASSSTVDGNITHLVLGPQTFVMNESLRTVVFEERVGRSIVFFTGTDFKPVIGWSSGYAKNDFGGDPAVQTIVLPSKYTTLVMENHALRGNSRAALYFSGSDTGDQLKGSSVNSVSDLFSNPTNSSYGITNGKVADWRRIGKEDQYGYYFNTETKNSFGLDQSIPTYAQVLYKETINAPGVNNLEVEVGTGNTKEYVENNKCSFVTGTANGKATMTNYLYDRYDGNFNGTAIVPGVVQNSTGSSFSVNTIGNCAFSAAYCDNTSYKNLVGHADLTAISLPDSIVTIGDYAFMRAYGVTKISSHNATTNVTNGDYVMPSALRNINRHAFAFCNVEKILNIPLDCKLWETNNNTTNQTCAFSNNFSLRQITFGNGASSSTYYETTTYSHGGNETYTSALYSKGNVSKNASSLLLVLNRDAADNHTESEDLTDDVENNVHHGKFNGQYRSLSLYGAFKMCYWVDRLIIGIPNNSNLDQPLISGIQDTIYLNQEIKDFNDYTCDLTTVSFGSCELNKVPGYAFEGAENLTKIELPRRVGETIPAGLLSFVTNPNLQFVVPHYNEQTGEYDTKTCDPGELDLTDTGYIGIDANAFKNTGITKLIAPKTSVFTIEEDAFAGTSLTEVDFRNVTTRVVLNSSFRGATIATSGTFKYNNTALIEFGKETFKQATFSDATFVFPATTAIIGESCFEKCSSLENVSAAASLAHLELVDSDSTNGKNNDGSDNLATQFRQIGDFAFYMCTSLNNFDFTNFDTITRIGHFAFSMNDKVSSNSINTEGDPSNNNAIICEEGNLDLPASITNLGVGAFYGSKIKNVTINSARIKFERGKQFTECQRAQTSRGCFQFRYCKDLKKVYFSDPDCKWDTLYLPKKKGSDNNNDQSNIFSNCGKLDILYLPLDFDVQHFDNVDPDDPTKRPDSMIWGSNNNIKVYLNHTLNNIIPSYNHGVCIYWHRTTAQLYQNLVYRVFNILDVCDYDDNNSTYTLKASATGQRFWATVDGVDEFLGSVIDVDSTGVVTFKNDKNVVFKADSTHVYKVV